METPIDFTMLDDLQYLLQRTGKTTVRKEWNQLTDAEQLEVSNPHDGEQLIAWALNNGYTWRDNAASVIAFGGNLSLLKFAVSKGCILDDGVYRDASIRGHLGIVIWAYENKCPHPEEIIMGAALGGNNNILDWAQGKLKRGLWIPLDLYHLAIIGGHVHTLVWLKSNVRPSKFRDLMMVIKAAHPKIEVLVWLLDNTKLSLKREAKVTTVAACIGNMEVIQRLAERDFSFGAEEAIGACLNGKIEVLQWLHSRGVKFDERACKSAAAYGHLDILKWLRRVGCPWDWTTCGAALGQGHQEVYNWAATNGCYTDCMQGRSKAE